MDPLHQILRFLSSGGEACSLDETGLAALRLEHGSASWRWPLPLDRDSALEVVSAIADARARGTWPGLAHAHQEIPAGDPRLWHARYRAQAPEVLAHAGPSLADGPHAAQRLEALYCQNREAIWAMPPVIDWPQSLRWLRAYRLALPAPIAVPLPCAIHF